MNAFHYITFGFLVLFTFGIASAIGEYGTSVNWPFSTVSLDSMVFGAMGAAFSEIMAYLSRGK